MTRGRGVGEEWETVGEVDELNKKRSPSSALLA